MCRGFVLAYVPRICVGLRAVDLCWPVCCGFVVDLTVICFEIAWDLMFSRFRL
jgi:hypothetical protein